MLARHGQKRDVTGDDNSGEMSSKVTSRLTLDDLGMSRNIAAAGIKLLALTPIVPPNRDAAADRGRGGVLEVYGGHHCQ